MKYYIKFEAHVSTTSVNFPDVTVTVKNGKLISSIYSKPTDVHNYLTLA